MVWRKGRELPAGRVLMMDRALTWRNSMPRNSPRPTWRSTSGKSAACASSPSVLHRTRGERSERTFATLPRHASASDQLLLLHVLPGHVLRILLVDPDP